MRIGYPESTINKRKMNNFNSTSMLSSQVHHFEVRCYWLRFFNILFDVKNIFENRVQMSVTQYRPSVLQKHWSRIDAFSLLGMEEKIKDHKDIFKWHSYKKIIMVGELGKSLRFGCILAKRGTVSVNKHKSIEVGQCNFFLLSSTPCTRLLVSE